MFANDSVLLDTLSIIPNSEILRDSQYQIIADSSYRINYSKSTLYFDHNLYDNQNLEIVYRVFPYNFSKPYPNLPTVVKNNSLPHYDQQYQQIYTPDIEANDEKSTLLVNGNISRGMSVGNSQNMVINSNLNLQLSGELTEGLFIDALLSDKNIPVQPDGYSQQIQEFDQVYIRIYDSIRSLQMGDVEINGGESYFLKFNRRVLGGDFNNQKITLGENTSANIQVSGAISKGKFNRSPFMGIEGVQGPYPLHGVNNETFIMILAGTERVYLDGVLLERGENADYVINYNTAEVSFTPKHFITKDSRIIAEYEYSDKNYNRFLFYTKANVKHNNGKYSVQYFNESDAKSQPVNQLLTQEHKRILADAGDNYFDAIAPNYDSVGFDINLVLYKMIDTTVNSVFYDSVLVYSTHKDSAFYQAGFSLVGSNKGNYIQDITPANGKVFRWVSPLNSIPQGNYEPLQLLIAPQKQSVIIAKSEYQITKQTRAIIEVAISDKDINTFSDKDATNDKGIAIKNFIEHTMPMHSKSLNVNFTYEMAQKDFNPIERYRSTEFNRDWNIVTPILHDEHFLKSEAILHKGKVIVASFTTEHLNYSEEYMGFRNSLSTNLTVNKFTIIGNASLLNTRASINKTQFYRHNLKIIRPVGIVKLGIQHDFENNLKKQSLSDSLLLLSRKYSLTEGFISSIDSAKSTFKIAYKNRVDFLPFNNSMQSASKTNDVVFNAKLKPNKIQHLSGSVTWRELQIINENIVPNQKSDQNLLARVDHQIRINKRLLSLFTFYEIGTGMETRKEFSYIEVAIGQGIYVWVDYNNNGIPELDEFEISPFPEEANYLKIYTPTNDYIKVYSLKFNETIKLDFSKIWRNSSGFKQILSRFNNTITFRAIQKHTQSNLVSRILPLPSYVDDSSQINRNVSLRNILSFNRVHPKFGADYIYSNQNQKSLLTNGFDITENIQHQIKLRWNITTEVLLLNISELQSSHYTSEYFTKRDYLIDAVNNNNTLQWQPTSKFRASIAYHIKRKGNRIGGEKALLQELGPDIKINSPKRGMLSARASLIINSYNGDVNSPITYTMLEGFLPGENYKWVVNFSRNINKFLRLNISYNGRKPAKSSIIHTGQFSLNAYF